MKWTSMELDLPFGLLKKLVEIWHEGVFHFPLVNIQV
jgi:hypothetical protein